MISSLGPILLDVSVLISTPSVIDLGDLPIHNQAIQGVQKPLEDITDSPDIAAAEPSIQLKE
jgi:hypothetical protein